jgi:hypothetical protein
MAKDARRAAVRAARAIAGIAKTIAAERGHTACPFPGASECGAARSRLSRIDPLISCECEQKRFVAGEMVEHAAKAGSRAASRLLRPMPLAARKRPSCSGSRRDRTAPRPQAPRPPRARRRRLVAELTAAFHGRSPLGQALAHAALGGPRSLSPVRKLWKTPGLSRQRRRSSAALEFRAKPMRFAAGQGDRLPFRNISSLAC